MATGWVKDGDNWCYCENSGERRYSDLKTDVFTFKIDKKTGICSNFTDNHTPSEQAGWWPTNLGNDELVKEAALGRIVFYNNQWWTTPEAAWTTLNPVTVYEHDVSADTDQLIDLPLLTFKLKNRNSGPNQSQVYGKIKPRR